MQQLITLFYQKDISFLSLSARKTHRQTHRFLPFTFFIGRGKQLDVSLIQMKDFFHFGPPFAFLAACNRILTRIT